MNDCIFCKIVNNQVPRYIISENDNVIVFLSLENHPLVVPKKHIKDIYDLDAETGAEIMKELIKIAKAVKKGLGCEGVYITQANESAAGQDVFHIHFHVYPRWQGKIMNQTERVEEVERSIILEKIKKAIFMDKKLKKLPKFQNEDEERKFWDTHSSVDYFDWSKAQNAIFPNLKPTSRSISIRIPEYLINRVKVEANKLDIPYQALMKQYISEGVLREQPITKYKA